MARRSSYRRRRSAHRRASSRRYRRRPSSRRRSRSPSRRRHAYSRRRYTARRPSYTRVTHPCPPGFTRNPATGRCKGSKYNVPEYTTPRFDSSIRNVRTGAPLSFRSKYGSLAEALKAREGKAAPFSLRATPSTAAYTGPATTRDESGHFAGGRRRSWF